MFSILNRLQLNAIFKLKPQTLFTKSETATTTTPITINKFQPLVKRFYSNTNNFDGKRRIVRRRRQLIFAVGALGTYTTYYYLSHLEQVPMSNRRRFISVTKEEEELMARGSYTEIIRQFRTRLLPHQHPYHQIVHSVSERIIKAAGLDHLNWDVTVIQKDDEINAFVLPGGKIFVFTGLLRLCGGDEDQLAAVIGHECAHLLARHAAEKVSLYKAIFTLQLIASLIWRMWTQVQDNRDQGHGHRHKVGWLFNPMLLELGFMLPFSRQCETEADYIGLMLMAQACYDPQKAIPFWRKMQEFHQGQGAQFLSTHPMPEKRVEQIREWIPEALNRFHMSDCHSYMNDLDLMFREMSRTSIRW